MLMELLGSNLGPIVQKVAATLGIAEPQAQAFTQKAISLLEGFAKNHPAELGSMLQGDPTQIFSKIDLSSLSGLVGGDPAKAGVGLQSVLEGISTQLGKGDLMSQVMGQFGGQMGGQPGGAGGGMLGALGGMASKFLKG